MNKQVPYQNENSEIKENVLAGIVGAFLFSLAGGVLWFVLNLLGIIAALSGLVGAVCAIKGYSVFAKKESTKGIIISVVIAVLVMVIAWYMGLSYDVYMAHRDWCATGEIDYMITFAEAVGGSYYYLFDAEIGPAYLGDLGLGLLFCVIGGGSYVVNKLKNAKLKANASAPEAVPADVDVSKYAVPAENVPEEIKEETKPEEAAENKE